MAGNIHNQTKDAYDLLGELVLEDKESGPGICPCCGKLDVERFNVVDRSDTSLRVQVRTHEAVEWLASGVRIQDIRDHLALS